MTEIHDRTGHWPALLGVDYAGRGGIDPDAPNEAAIEYWQQGGLVTVSTHLYNPARTNASGGLRDKGVDLNTLLDPSSDTHVRWMHELDQVAAGLQQLKDGRRGGAVAAVSRDERGLVLVGWQGPGNLHQTVAADV